MNLSLRQADTIARSRSTARVDGIARLESSLGPVTLWLEVGYRVDDYGTPADPRTGDVGEGPSVEVVFIELIGDKDNRLLPKAMFTGEQLAKLTEACSEDCQARRR